MWTLLFHYSRYFSMGLFWLIFHVVLVHFQRYQFFGCANKLYQPQQLEDIRRKRKIEASSSGCRLWILNILRMQMMLVIQSGLAVSRPSLFVMLLSKSHTEDRLSLKDPRVRGGVVIRDFSTLLAVWRIWKHRILLLLLEGTECVFFCFNLGKTTEGGTGRNSLFCQLSGVVFRGSPPRLWRCYLHPSQRKAGSGPQAARWCSCSHHPGT